MFGMGNLLSYLIEIPGEEPVKLIPMEILLSFVMEGLEVVKIYLLLYNLTAACVRRGRLRWLAIMGVIAVKTVCNALYGNNFVSYTVFVIIIICVAFRITWVENLIWGTWCMVMIGLMDAFWKVLLQFILEERVPSASMLHIYDGIPTIILLLIIGAIYKKINRVRFTLPITYYAIFMIVVLANELMLTVYTDGIRKEYGNEEIPYAAIYFLVVCAAGFLGEMLAILILGSMNYLHQEKEQMQEEMLIMQQEHYADLELRETDTRRFRHDIRDHIHVLKHLMEEQQYDEAYSYLVSMDKLVDSIRGVNVGNNAVNAVLSSYMSIAKNRNLTLSIEGRLPYPLYISDYELCTLVSNILRNAVEGARGYSGAIHIQFRYDEKYVYICEQNPCDKGFIVKDGLPDTSKSDKHSHGFGFGNMKQVVDRNGGFLTVHAEQGEFYILVTLRNEVIVGETVH